MQVFGFRHFTFLSVNRVCLPLERPEHVVFLCFTHLPVVIPPRRLLERVSTLLGKPGSSTTKSLQDLRSLLRTAVSISMLIQNISGGLSEWQSLCMIGHALATPLTRQERNCYASRGTNKLLLTKKPKIC